VIKPPFTVLILKNTHHPVTIRVTKGFILTTFVFISVVSILIGIGTFYLVFNTNIETHEAFINSSSIMYIPLQTENTPTPPKPDIHNLSVNYHKNGETEVTIHFSSLPEAMRVFVWLIVNPHAETPGEMVVYPRSPVFRGLPVDYRNGVVFLSSESDSLTISLSDEINGIDIQQFRILVYSSEGILLIDKNFGKKAKSET